ncbi:MAG TPA: pyridoxamine 5'-phosphate oxidase, partial [Burkholderiaceae bacterium]
MTARLQHLDEIEQCIWSELERCVAPRPPREADEGREPHDLRVAALETEDAPGDGDSPGVVLREVDAPERRLVFYTDARAPEVRRLESHPEGTLTFRSRRLGWQLRMRVRLAVERDGLAVSSRWARLQTRAGADDYR